MFYLPFSLLSHHKFSTTLCSLIAALVLLSKAKRKRRLTVWISIVQAPSCGYPRLINQLHGFTSRKCGERLRSKEFVDKTDNNLIRSYSTYETEHWSKAPRPGVYPVELWETDNPPESEEMKSNGVWAFLHVRHVMHKLLVSFSGFKVHSADFLIF